MKLAWKRQCGSDLRHATQAFGRRWFDVRKFAPFWQIGIKKTEHMRALDCTNAFLFLQAFDALVKFFHLRPMHFRPEMLLGMIAVVEKQPVVDFSVAAYPPGNRFIGICAIMAIVAVEITEAVAQVPERQEI